MTGEVDIAVVVLGEEFGDDHDFASLGDVLDQAGVTRTIRGADKEVVPWITREADDPLSEVVVSEPERVYAVGRGLAPTTPEASAGSVTTTLHRAGHGEATSRR